MIVSEVVSYSRVNRHTRVLRDQLGDKLEDEKKGEETGSLGRM